MTYPTTNSSMLANQITKIDGQPTALDIAKVQREIIEIAGGMTNPESKQYGHVGMMMFDVEFQKFAKDSGHTGAVTSWKPPKESGPRPEFKKGSDKDEYRILVEAWKYDNEVEALYMEGGKKLKIQITNAVKAQFLSKIRNKTDTLHRLGPKNLLDHLKARNCSQPEKARQCMGWKISHH
jgi:hypothetical protein